MTAHSPTLIRALAVTVELTQTELSPEAARIMADDLSRYPEHQVLAALSRCRRELRGRLTIGDVVARLDDGRPSADEAWGMLPRDEADSAVWTDEMRAAYFDAVLPLLREGETTAARMAFRSAYERAVGQARDAAIPVAWSATLGHDPERRALALHAAVEKRRLPAATVATLLPPPVTPEDALAGRRLLGSVLSSGADTRDRLRALRTTLKRSLIAERQAKAARLPDTSEEAFALIEQQIAAREAAIGGGEQHDP